MTTKITAPALGKMVLSKTEIELAKKLGMTPYHYAMHKMQNTPPAPSEDDFEFDPNKQEIMNAPIKALRDIWEVKFGARWVEVDSLDEDWDKIHGRLDQYDLFEEYSAGDWIKLKEQL